MFKEFQNVVEQLFIACYYRQFSKDIKDKIKASFVSPEGLKDQTNKTDIDFLVFILVFVENCL